MLNRSNYSTLGYPLFFHLLFLLGYDFHRLLYLVSVLFKSKIINDIQAELRIPYLLSLISNLLFLLTLFAVFFTPLVLLSFLLKLAEVYMLSEPLLFLSLYQLLVSEFDLFGYESLFFFFQSDFVFTSLLLLLFLREHILSFFE